jgi:hypothetical protein
MLDKPIRFYLVPKGTEYNTPPNNLNGWRPVQHTRRCLVFDDYDEADACLVDIVRSKGRHEIELAYQHKSFRCDGQRHSYHYRPGRNSLKTNERHLVPDCPEIGTIIVAVAWLREEVPLPNGKLGYKKSTPMTIPAVRMFRYDSSGHFVVPTATFPPRGTPLRPQVDWGHLPDIDTETLIGGSVIRLFALSNLG